MRHTDTVIIGGGQAGLAMSHCLAREGIDHVVLERGQVAQTWRGHWDSLRLLTPNWQSRLPGYRYTGSDPGGFMTRDTVVAYLSRYERHLTAPVLTRTTVLSLWEVEPGRFVVETNRGRWTARSIVMATGDCGSPRVLRGARDLSPQIEQWTTASYKNPKRLQSGGVLVVGAGATGVQLAREIQRAGRQVTLAVGRHSRMPRRYRGEDIMAWLAMIGVWDERATEVPDLTASRNAPSLQLLGSQDDAAVDLGSLREEGVRLVGSVRGFSDGHVFLNSDINEQVSASDAKLRRLLRRVDAYVERRRLRCPDPEQLAPLGLVETPERLALHELGITNVVWATGYQKQRYPWLHVPVLDDRGQLLHFGGVTSVPGLYALGLRFMRHRNSNFIDGVGRDARAISLQIKKHLGGLAQAA